MTKYAELELVGSYVELVHSRTKAKVAASTEVAERMASLTSECAAKTATLQEREEQLHVKELDCAKLRRSLAAEKYLHMKKELECKELQVDISNAQKITVELRYNLKLYEKEFAREFKPVEELMATLAARDQSHDAELALKAKELADCKAIRTSELELRKELDADCSRLRSQLSAVEEQLVTAQAKLMETKSTVQQLEQQTDAALRARVERCLRCYVEWEIQITKWIKLDELERRVKELEASRAAGHRQLGRKINSFISGLEETKENLQLELSAVLSMIGEDRGLANVATAASAEVASDGGSQLAGDASGCSL